MSIRLIGKNHTHYQLNKMGLSLGVLCVDKGEVSFAPFVAHETARDDQYINAQNLPLFDDFIQLLTVFRGDPVEVVTETVFRLWNIFGGTVNSKGFKVLNPHVKALYGDSITPQRCQQIYKILERAGFAINNVALGVGSFSMQCLETMNADHKSYAPYTRDTFGIAVKATYAEDADGRPIMIFKNPKTDTGHFKKSQRGCCRVVRDGDNYTHEDGLTWAEAQENNELRVVFKNGEFIKTYTLDEVRQNLHGGQF